MPLSSIPFIPYLNDQGQLSADLVGKVGIYAIFDEAQTLQFVGYSRDIQLSLKQHLIRCPHQCKWVKTQLVDRPSRTALETIRDEWIAENGSIPPGNGTEEAQWTQPIDAKAQMTPDEQATLDAATSEMEQTKILKAIARRVEADITATLEAIGLKEPIRFDPKLKEQGLLNVKP